MIKEVPQVSPAETQIICQLATAQLPVPGAYVELGCYRGETSLLLQKILQTSGNPESRSLPAQNSPAQPSPINLSPTQPLATQNPHHPSPAQPPDSRPPRLYLYDSFAGLPEKSPADSSPAGDHFQPGALAVTKREVVQRFRQANLPVPVIKKAFFEDLTPADLPELISFAFLDGDFYQSIRVSLALVAPRLAEQGIIIVHDYNNPQLPGPARAVEEFLRQTSVESPAPKLSRADNSVLRQPSAKYNLTQRHSLAILRPKM